jgi:hypothetical protein
LVEQNVACARGVVAKVAEDVVVFDGFDVFVVAHDPPAAGPDDTDVVAVVGTAEM